MRIPSEDVEYAMNELIECTSNVLTVSVFVIDIDLKMR